MPMTMPPDLRARVIELLVRSGVGIDDILPPQSLHTSDGMVAWRIGFKDQRGWQNESGRIFPLPPDADQIWSISGFHSSDLQGTYGILSDKKVRSGEFGVVYFKGCLGAVGTEDLIGTFVNAKKSKKFRPDVRVSFEIRARGETAASSTCPRYEGSGGGTSWDKMICSEGKIAHFNNSSKHNRWSCHESLINLRAIWIDVHEAALERIEFLNPNFPLG